jgi:NAD(P)-dependent dehydrogenase (short-subunit alcohol dehydrogenase family)
VSAGGVLAGRRAVVTGSGRGLGAAYAKALAANGAAVVVNGTTPDAVHGVVEEIRAAGGEAVAHPGTIASFAGAEALIAAAVAAFGGVDVVVNNAGVIAERMMFNMTEEEFRGPLEVDCFGTFAVSRFAVRDMRPRRWGRIVNTADISAQTGLLGGTNVAAAKGAILGMTYTWGAELARWGITANAIIPEAYTRMHDPLLRKTIELAEARGGPVPTFEELVARVPKPDEITALLVYLASDESAWLNGQVLTMTKKHLGLWSHAAEKAALRSTRGGFTVDEVRERLQAAFAGHVEPVGINEPW